MIEFEWDSEKCLININKHGIDFFDVLATFDGDILTIEDDRYEYGEQRFLTYGLLQDVVVAIVHTYPEDAIRIISARRASKNEQRAYFEQISN